MRLCDRGRRMLVKGLEADLAGPGAEEKILCVVGLVEARVDRRLTGLSQGPTSTLQNKTDTFNVRDIDKRQKTDLVPMVKLAT